MRQLLSGIIAMGSLVAALSFLKFWCRSGDRLFVLFGAPSPCSLRNAVAFGLSDPGADPRVGLYVVRLLAFVLILGAIADKNRSHRR